MFLLVWLCARGYCQSLIGIADICFSLKGEKKKTHKERKKERKIRIKLQTASDIVLKKSPLTCSRLVSSELTLAGVPSCLLMLPEQGRAEATQVLSCLCRQQLKSVLDNGGGLITVPSASPQSPWLSSRHFLLFDYKIFVCQRVYRSYCPQKKPQKPRMPPKIGLLWATKAAKSSHRLTEE